MEDPGGASDADPATLPAGTRLGKYELVRLLGQGGMGAVYEATHLEMGKRVAVKTLSPAVAAIPGAKARFLREAQLTSRARHPHIVDVTDVGTDAGYAYLVMELLSGEDLAQRLERSGPLAPDAIVDVMLPVCSAVIAAHQEGVIHRDLKPQNIFLAAGPRGVHPKVLDFGISKNTTDVGPGALTQTSAMIGTPYYLAPEQIQNARSASPSSDQYALGVILYECLSGRRPFEGDTLFSIFQQIVAGSAAPLHAAGVQIPAALEDVIRRAMSVDPKARFGSLRELGGALLPFASTRARFIWEEAFGAPAGSPPAADSAPIASAPPRRVAPTTPLPPSLTPMPPAKTPPPPVTTPLPPAALARSGATPAPQRGTAVFPSSPGTETHAFDSEPLPPRQGGQRRAFTIAAAATMVGALAVVIWLLTSGGERPPPPPAVEEPVVEATKVVPPPVTTKVEPTPEAPKPFSVSVTVEPNTAAIDLDGKRVGTGHFEVSLPKDQTRHTLKVSADGFETRVLDFVDSPPPERIALQRSRTKTPAKRIERPAGNPVRPPPRTLNPNNAPVID